MKVYREVDGERRLVGRADIPPDSGPAFEVPLFGAASIIREQFTIGTITHVLPGGGAPIVERVVLLASGQPPDLLPGWQPLAS
jgi:hypothetical protein